jgi:hypothetical protein
MRPSAHQIGDIGLNAVEKIFLDAGWVVNRIASDYGEDLSIQPVAGGNVEKFRIYVQVKAIESRNRGSVSLRVDDLFIWQFSNEMFLLVCWLEFEKRAFYKWMNKTRAVRDYALNRRKTSSINIRNMSVLDSKALAFLQVTSKNLYYDELLGQISRFISDIRGYRKNRTLPAALSAKLVAVRVACRMLCEAGVFERRGNKNFPSGDFLHSNLMQILQDGLEQKQKGERLNSLFRAIKIVTYAWENKYGHLPSENLMWALVNAVEVVITSTDNFRSIVRRVSRRTT